MQFGSEAKFSQEHACFLILLKTQEIVSHQAAVNDQTNLFWLATISVARVLKHAMGSISSESVQTCANDFSSTFVIAIDGGAVGVRAAGIFLTQFLFCEDSFWIQDCYISRNSENTHEK